MTLWNNKLFRCERIEEGKGFIVIEGLYQTGAGDRVEHVGIINVYSTGNLNDESALWENLGHIKNKNINFAWCVVGDFNTVKDSSERKGVVL